MGVKATWGILKQTIREFGEHNVLRLSAALAYYSIFSIGPLLAIVVGLAGLAFGVESVRHQVQDQLRSMLGEGAAKTITSMMAAQRKGTSLVTTIIGVVALLFGAAGVFGQLQDSLNTIWGVKVKPGAGLWNLVRNRFLSFSMVLGIGFLLLVSMALSTAISAFTGAIGGELPGLVGHSLDFVISFVVVTLLFAMIFKFLPDVKVPWKTVWIGAVATTFLFTIGKILLGLYLGRQSTTSAYGAAGSVIVILLWVYYASVILLLGAEFTQVYAHRLGAVVRPSHYAVPVTGKEMAQQGIPEAKGFQKEPIKATGPHGLTRSNRPAKSPGEVVYGDTLGVLSLMVVTGFIAGTVLQMRPLRKAIKMYGKVRKTAAAVSLASS